MWKCNARTVLDNGADAGDRINPIKVFILKTKRGMQQQKEKISQQLNIELPAEVSQGAYSNFVIVVHSPAEFVIDFATIMPGVPKPRVIARIIMTPVHAKRFLQVLQDNIAKYESTFGEIKIPVELRGPEAFFDKGVGGNA